MLLLLQGEQQDDVSRLCPCVTRLKDDFQAALNRS